MTATARACKAAAKLCAIFLIGIGTLCSLSGPAAAYPATITLSCLSGTSCSGSLADQPSCSEQLGCGIEALSCTWNANSVVRIDIAVKNRRYAVIQWLYPFVLSPDERSGRGMFRQIYASNQQSSGGGASLATVDNKIIATAIMSRDGPLSATCYVELTPLRNDP